MSPEHSVTYFSERTSHFRTPRNPGRTKSIINPGPFVCLRGPPMKRPPSPLSFPDRRQFLRTGGALAAGLLSHEAQATTNQLPALPANPRTQASMATRNLGKTGYKVGLFSLGAQAAVERPNNFDVAVAIIERCLDLGVNLIDTAPRYGFPERW